MSLLSRSNTIRNYSKSITKLISKHNTTHSLSILLNQRRFNSDDIQGFNFNFDDDNDSYSGGYSQDKYTINPNRQRQPSFNMFGNDDGFGFGGKQQRKMFSRAQIEWNKENLIPFTKDFYTEHPEITELTQQQVEQFRKSNSMIIHGSNIPKPFKQFENSGLPGIKYTN